MRSIISNNLGNFTHDGDPDTTVAVCRPIDILRSQQLEPSRRNDVFEEIKVGITSLSVGEGGDVGRSRPRDDSDEQ